MSKNSAVVQDIIRLVHRKQDSMHSFLAERLCSDTVENRYNLPPQQLEELGRENIQLYLSFLEGSDPGTASNQGKKMAAEGLGGTFLLEIGRIFRQFYIEHLSASDHELLKAAVESVDSFTRALLDGYLEQREQQILAQQEQLRLELSTALELQRRELYIKNQAIHSSINGIILCDLHGQVTYANPALLRMWGYTAFEELKGASCSRFWGEEGERVLSMLMETGGWQGETSSSRRDGSVLDVAISASVIRDTNGRLAGIICFFYDVSERKRLEAQFRQAQKMEALGQLAGGIVHDFNNLLTAISGYSQLALLELPEDSKTYQDFLQIKTATDRGRELTQELRIFTRQTSSKREPLGLNQIVEETYKLLLRTFPPVVKISLELDPRLRGIKAIPSQMSQMLMNLCVNARDAILSAREKRKDSEVQAIPEELAIKTYNIELDWRSASRFIHARPGRYVCLSVKDTGHGIPAKNLDRLFEPFFTTKGEKSGTGLGLAVVYGIVQNHEGFIDVHSREGSGSIFNIYLPVAETEQVEEAAHPYAPDLAVGRGTILVAEDNPQVQAMIGRALEESGYKVLAAENGADAISIYRKRGKSIDLVILDMLMPHVGGKDCFYHLKSIDPQVKILLMTGFTTDSSMDSFMEEGAAGVIIKPFELQAFTAAVHTALSGSAKKSPRKPNTRHSPGSSSTGRVDEAPGAST